jgi:hypothetical protein
MRTRNRRLIRLVDIMLLLLLIVGAVLGASLVQRVRHHVTSALSALDELEAILGRGATDLVELAHKPDRLASIQDNIATIDAELSAVERLSRPVLPLFRRLAWLPVLGGDISAVPDLLAVARNTTDAAQTAVTALSPLAHALRSSDAGIGYLGPELVVRLQDAQPEIAAAQASLEQASQSRAAVDLLRLSATPRDMVLQFDRYLPLIKSGLDTLSVLPVLLGAEEPQTYLILAQNNHELRATGGFVSGVGLVEIQRGQVTNAQFEDSYTVDDLSQPHPLAPDPLRRHMGAGMLVLRDANWWPDFPTSAEKMAKLYLQDQGGSVDGVITVDLIALELLLAALDPIEVPGYDQPITKQNLQAAIMKHWEAPRLTAPGKEVADWWSHRKDFAADLMAALLLHLTEQATLQEVAALAEAAGKALQQRHILFYVNNPQINAFAKEMNWDGSLHAGNGDFLLATDSNVGFNKVNPNIEQTLDYQVTLDSSGNVTAQLTLAYQHLVTRPTPACVLESRYGDSYQDLMERCYWDYVRLYVPGGSELIDVEGADQSPEVYQEGDLTVVGLFFLLETGQSRQIRVTYRPALPDFPESYRLLIQKQAGTEAIPLRVTVNLPPGSSPASITPASAVWVDDRLVWQGDLAQDREIEVSWE